jgi:hypothetical protein
MTLPDLEDSARGDDPGDCPTCRYPWQEAGPCGSCGTVFADCDGADAYFAAYPDADDVPDAERHAPVSFAAGGLSAPGWESCPRCLPAGR